MAQLQDAIKKVLAGHDLPEDEMMAVMTVIMQGCATEAQIAALITALKMKGETVDEVTGAARAMRAHATAIPLADPQNLMDIVGTGGDMSDTFNISTAACFVAAAAGLRIAKHGNRCVSSRCGSADVIESLDISIEMSPQQVAGAIREIGLGFLFAPRLHPAMRHAAKPRRDIGFRTIFNILGPLTNPADAGMRVIGVYDDALIDLVSGALPRLGCTRALVVHGCDGLDEITLCDTTAVCSIAHGNLKRFTIHPSDAGYDVCARSAIRGGTPSENAAIIRSVLSGAPGAPRNIVCMNAAAAIQASGNVSGYTAAVRTAEEAIDSGRALKILDELRAYSRDCRGV
jgi:anthranilate phosphoribosyltransferase